MTHGHEHASEDAHPEEEVRHGLSSGRKRFLVAFTAFMVVAYAYTQTTGTFETQSRETGPGLLPDPTSTDFDPSLTPTLTPTVTQVPQPESHEPVIGEPTIIVNGNCVTIAFPQPRNAFRAWKALGEPQTLVFHDEQGPFRNPHPQTVNRQTLPWWVHVGDRFCK